MGASRGVIRHAHGGAARGEASEAWLAIVPEPSMLSLLASGLFLIARRRPATRRTS